MYLFLQGPPRVGKSTILRNALLPWEGSVSGLMVQRLFEDGRVCGFRACSVHGTLPALEMAYEEDLDGVFLYHGKAFPAVLEHTVSRAEALCAEESCKLIILDEIGGLELSSKDFMRSLEGIMALHKPCLGVIKSRENLAHTAGRLGLSSNILCQRERLHRDIEAGGNILDVSESNLAEITQAVSDFVAAVQDG